MNLHSDSTDKVICIKISSQNHTTTDYIYMIDLLTLMYPIPPNIWTASSATNHAASCTTNDNFNNGTIKQQ